jgi:hypothetical protein
MKSPNRANAEGAFLMSFTNTVASTVNDIAAPHHANTFDRRFYWCRETNSALPLIVRNGKVSR